MTARRAPADTIDNFDQFGLRPELLSNLESLGYTAPTPIQTAALPPALAGSDIIGLANTGAGKTAAFGLAVLNRINPSHYQPQVLVLCPTRELADQVAAELRLLARGMPNIKVLTLCGGVPIGPQIGSLEHGAHVLVGTPGRVQAHRRKQTLAPESIRIVVLDEADRMLDMGFEEQIDAITGALARRRQTLMFSATFPPDVERVAARYLSAPTRVEAGAALQQAPIAQRFHRIDSESVRLTALLRVLQAEQAQTSIVFCATKQSCADVAAALRTAGVDAQALHGDLTQSQRDLALIQLSNHSLRVLVATDVAARGLDISGLDLVVNFEPARDAETHTHRIGRTGRLSGGATQPGLAITLFSDDQAHRVAQLETEMDPIAEAEPLPDAPPKRQDRPDGADHAGGALRADYVTLQINAGRKQKIRPGDVLGALTAGGAMTGTQVGKIQVTPMSSYVAVYSDARKAALHALNNGSLKGRRCRARLIR